MFANRSRRIGLRPASLVRNTTLAVLLFAFWFLPPAGYSYSIKLIPASEALEREAAALHERFGLPGSLQIEDFEDGQLESWLATDLRGGQQEVGGESAWTGRLASSPTENGRAEFKIHLPHVRLFGVGVGDNDGGSERVSINGNPLVALNSLSGHAIDSRGRAYYVVIEAEETDPDISAVVFDRCGTVHFDHLAVAQEPFEDGEIVLVPRLIIDLIDGSRIIGSYSDESVPIAADAAQLDLPLERVSSIQFAGDARRTLVVLKNGDKVTGSLGTQTLSVETVLGPMEIPTAKIHSLNVRLRRLVEPGETNRTGAQLNSPEPMVQGRSLREWLGDLQLRTEPQIGGGFFRVEHPRSAVPEQRSAAIAALQKIGPDAVPFLLTMLRQGGQEAGTAVQAFASLGELGKPALPELLVLFDHPDGVVRNYAMLSLGHIGAPAAVAVPVLVEECQAGNRTAATSLGNIGPAAASAVPALLQQLEETNEPQHQIQLVEALGKIGGRQAVGTLAAVLQRYKAEHPQNRGMRGISAVLIQKAVEALGRMGSDSREAVPALIDLLKDPGPEPLNLPTRLAAIQALGAIGPDAKESVPLLEKIATERTHPLILRAASAALRQIHPADP